MLRALFVNSPTSGSMESGHEYLFVFAGDLLPLAESGMTAAYSRALSEGKWIDYQRESHEGGWYRLKQAASPRPLHDGSVLI